MKICGCFDPLCDTKTTFLTRDISNYLCSFFTKSIKAIKNEDSRLGKDRDREEKEKRMGTGACFEKSLGWGLKSMSAPPMCCGCF